MTCEAWPIVWPCDLPAGSTDEQKDAAQAAAQLVLWSRTGRRLGSCEAVETFDVGGDCLPDSTQWIWLTAAPISAVTTVTVNSAVRSAELYRLEGSRLRPVGTGYGWVGSGGPALVEVAYTWGVPLVDGDPLAGLAAAAMGEVANEWLNAQCGGECRLPSSLASVARQGVTKTFRSLDEQPLLLGLPIADQLILSVNPDQKVARSRVYSPDMPARVS